MLRAASRLQTSEISCARAVHRAVGGGGVHAQVFLAVAHHPSGAKCKLAAL